MSGISESPDEAGPDARPCDQPAGFIDLHDAPESLEPGPAPMIMTRDQSDHPPLSSHHGGRLWIRHS